VHSESDTDVACELMSLPFSMIMDLLKMVTFLNAVFIKKLNMTCQPRKVVPC
jgi:hypothetical protein